MMPLPSGNEDNDGLEAALMVLDEYMTSEWSEGAEEDYGIDQLLLERITTEEHADGASAGDQASTLSPPSRGMAPRRRRSKSSSKQTALASSYSSSSSSKDGGGSSSSKKAATWDPNKARNERKGELIYLRKRVSDLEVKLQRLMDSRQPSDGQGSPLRRLDGSSGGDTTSPPSPSPPLPASSEQLVFCGDALRAPSTCMWRGMAHRQCQERLKSERENVRLKLVLEKQLKIAKTLNKIVTKKAAIKELERCVQGIGSESDTRLSLGRTDGGEGGERLS